MKRVRIKVQLFASFRDQFGTKEFSLDCDGTIPNFIEMASKALDSSFKTKVFDEERGAIRDGIIFSINGRNLKDLKDPQLQENDVVAIFPPVAGG